MAYSLDFYFYIKGEKWNQLKKRTIAAVRRRLDLVKCIIKISRDL